MADVCRQMDFHADVHVVGISVAALMHADWLNRKLTNEPTGYDHVLVPGWCQGDLSVLTDRFSVPFSKGPKDILDLARFFGEQSRAKPDLTKYDIEILAEINHAPQLTNEQIIRLAARYQSDGADVIDIGCIPGFCWERTAEIVAILVSEGHRISIDSFDRREVETAIQGGAELVLSCNSSNVEWLAKLGVEVVVIPDDPSDLESMWTTIKRLQAAGCPFRADPILEPIGFGFAASLARYYAVRSQNPDVPLMMGIGNLTELTEVDSAGVNGLLAAICQELSIQSVLTTEVIPWCRTAVKEFDLARRLMKHAIDQQTLPKHVDAGLVMLRDPQVSELGEGVLEQMSHELRDRNYRIFVEGDQIHVMNRNGYWKGTDAYEIFDSFVEQDDTLEPSHAFYLGYELAKAVTALTLGKQYRQDQALHWGFLTVPEQSAHDRRRQRNADDERGPSGA